MGSHRPPGRASPAVHKGAARWKHFQRPPEVGLCEILDVAKKLGCQVLGRRQENPSPEVARVISTRPRRHKGHIHGHTKGRDGLRLNGVCYVANAARPSAEVEVGTPVRHSDKKGCAHGLLGTHEKKIQLAWDLIHHSSCHAVRRRLPNELKSCSETPSEWPLYPFMFCFHCLCG